MDLVAVGIAAFLVGGAVARTRTVMEAALRETDSRRAAEAARADGLARQLKEERALMEGAKSQLADTFTALAHETLRASQGDFLALAHERLGAGREQTGMDGGAGQAGGEQGL